MLRAFAGDRETEESGLNRLHAQAVDHHEGHGSRYAPLATAGGIYRLILKRCTRSLSKPRSYEETMRCRFDPALEPMPAEATHLSPPCCVSTHRSRVVDPIPQRFWFTGRLSPQDHR